MVSFKTGSVRRFFVQTERPGLGDMTEAMAAHAHREIDPTSEVEMSVGWCGFWDERVADPTQLDVSLVGFGFRVDTLKVPSAVLAPKTRDACEALKQELKLDSLNRQQIADMRAQVKQRLRLRIPPRTQVTQVVWSEDEKDVVYLMTGSDAIAAQFHELFERTFDIQLTPDSVYARLKSGDLADDVEDLRVPAFVRVGSCVDQAPVPKDAPYLEHVTQWSRLGLAFLHHLAQRTSETHPVSIGGREYVIVDGGRADLVREDTTVKFRKGAPLGAAQLGDLLLEGSLLQSAGLELQGVGYADDFRAVVTGCNLHLSGITLPSVLQSEPEEHVVETCWLLDRLFEVFDTILERFVQDSAQMGLEAFDHITEWAKALAQPKE